MSTVRRVSPAAADAGIAAGVALLSLAGGLVAPGGGHTAVTALLVAMGLVLAARRRFPGTVLAVVTALTALLAVLGDSVEGTFIPVLIASYTAAVHGGSRVARALLFLAPAVLAGLGIPQALGAGGWAGAHLPVRPLLAAAGLGLAGLVIRKQFAARAEHAAVLAERAELIAAQQEERAHRAALAERVRIARELHDIVAHHLSVVVIQAQGAQRVADQDPDRAKRAMADVERTGRTALGEMRHLLGLLRTGEPGECGGTAEASEVDDDDQQIAPSRRAADGRGAAHNTQVPPRRQAQAERPAGRHRPRMYDATPGQAEVGPRRGRRAASAAADGSHCNLQQYFPCIV